MLVGRFRTTRALRVLALSGGLEAARLTELSYFDSTHAEQRERAVFLRRLRGRPPPPGGSGA